MSYVYTTWHCQNCPVQTSVKAFGEAHAKVPGHNVTVIKWAPIKESA